MRRISILGHFGICGNFLDGQTVKTRIIADELEKLVGVGEIKRFDTHGGLLFLLRLPFVALRMLAKSKNIVILPAQNGVKIIPLIIVVLNIFFRRKIHYIVIGGWLPVMVSRNRIILSTLKFLDGIHVETQSMKAKLNSLGLHNVYVMPNVKKLPIVEEKDFPHYTTAPYRLCTFSRVIKEKGIEDAISAVVKSNKKLGRKVFSLDIFGQVGQKEWFDEVACRFPAEVTYKGMVPYDKSVDILKDYYALLFPTYYDGECFAGTFLDAFASGLPVIASNWHDNADLNEEGKTGWLFNVHDVDALSDILCASLDKDVQKIRMNCIEKAKEYSPETIISEFVQCHL